MPSSPLADVRSFQEDVRSEDIVVQELPTGEKKSSEIQVTAEALPPNAAPLGRRQRLFRALRKYVGFIGPGMMIAIAYMDPGNYSTDVAAGAAKEYALLFVILLSTFIALYLQTLAIKLGCVTGKDLARACREHLPAWTGWILYFFAESAIIATDIAEVIGTAIALNILFKIPLIAGVCITIVDVMIVLLAYRPGKGMKAVRILEYVVALLLMAVAICFCILLAHIPPANVGHVFHGYLPTSAVISDGGVYMAAGILGATVMPHSLYLGSAMAVPRVRDYDEKHGFKRPEGEVELEDHYKPSRMAIGWAYRYSVWEMALTLCTFAIFVNSAILIVAGATMYGNDGATEADLYGLYDMLKQYLSKAAAVIFMVALLCSGQSAGIICTIAGQIVSEGHINWRCKPWLRRIITRLIAITPCLIVVGTVGKRGLSDALNWSQVVLTITLPFLAAPLVYLTSRSKIMTVQNESYHSEDNPETSEANTETTTAVDAPQNDAGKEATKEGVKDYANSWYSIVFGAAICVFILITNVYLLVQIGLNGQP